MIFLAFSVPRKQVCPLVDETLHICTDLRPRTITLAVQVLLLSALLYVLYHMEYLDYSREQLEKTIPSETSHPSLFITKTCLYNFDLHKPHFYIVKLGFTRVYIVFSVLLENIDYGYSLEPQARRF